MTVIEGIEIDDLHFYRENNTMEAIINNDPIEDKLNVIMVISNPCLYKKRYVLAREFIKRMSNYPHVELYIVELTYKNQKYIITEEKNKRHLQINTEIPLWHKENMINLGVEKLLPVNWKAFAWIDADIEFENLNWALDALKILNGTKDIIQLFSHCVDMNYDNSAMTVFSSAGYNYDKKNKFMSTGLNYWHPGFAWACTKKAYDKMGGLYDKSVLGSGDNCMMYSLLQNVTKAVNPRSNPNYIESLLDYQSRVKHLRFGYNPGVIRHYFHGTKKNRKYMERWQILIKNNYDPMKHVMYNEEGIIVPSQECPRELVDDIYKYFSERNEDEYLFVGRK